MNTDIRLMVTWPSHPKAKKLRLKLGDAGPLGFIYLLAYVGAYKPDGVLSGMDAEDIALAADYRGDPDEFVEILSSSSIRLLDFDGETYAIHDWKDWNPYAAGAKDRSEKARHAANVRHGKEKPARTENQSLTEKNDAPSAVEQCAEQETALQPAQESNAPSPSPSPSPYPSPYPEPDQERVPRKRGSPANRKTPIPKDFEISDAVRQWAEGKGFDQLDEHLEAFVCKAEAKGYQYVNWDRAFQEAIRKDWAGLREERKQRGTGTRSSDQFWEAYEAQA